MTRVGDIWLSRAESSHRSTGKVIPGKYWVDSQRISEQTLGLRFSKCNKARNHQCRLDAWAPLEPVSSN